MRMTVGRGGVTFLIISFRVVHVVFHHFVSYLMKWVFCAEQAAASKGMHVGKLLASWRRKVSLAVHVAHADNVLRGLSAVAHSVEAAYSSDGMRSHATAHVTRAMGRKRPRASSSGVSRRLSPPRVAFSALPRSFLTLIC
jgi:hypothetical protein